ncbi:phosphoribosylformylglycinamidine synthase subunit PurS [Sorangium sp. So ce124]
MELDPSLGSAPDLEQRLKTMADEMLANTVIEEYEVTIAP